MAFEIDVHELAMEELAGLRPFDQRRIIAAIEEQLRQQPTVATRRRKCLVGLVPGFEHVLPVWELRVGDFRVFYDVDVDSQRVHVRAVRKKEPPRTTREIT
jgi:mRNA-degrading endonuclease RelE of RelBE toxin-antitoxin system